MANSGQIRAGAGRSAFELNWTLVRQDVGGNFSEVSWEAVIRTNGMYYYTNAVKITGGGVNGNAIGTGTWSNITGDRQLLTGTMRIPHENDGRRSFYMDIRGWLYGSGDWSASGTFELPTIPRASSPSFSKRLYTVGERIVVNMNPKAGAFRHRGSVQVPDENVIKRFSDIYWDWGWTPSESEKDEMYKRMANTLRTSLGVDITTWNGGTQIGGTGWNNVEIEVNREEVRPDFDSFTFENDSKTREIIGNSVDLIKGFGALKVRVNSADKMVVKKYASAVNYRVDFDGKNEEIGEKAEDIVFRDLVANSSGDLVLSVRAKDSRGLERVVNKSVKVWDYLAPSVRVVAERANGFDKTTKVKISGNYSSLEGRNSIVGLKYRWKKEGESFGGWNNIVAVDNNGEFNYRDIYLELETVDRFVIEVEAVDRLGSVSLGSVNVSEGVPIMYISSSRKSVGVGKVANLGGSGDLDVAGDVYSRGVKIGGTHVGQIIISTTLKTPEAVKEIYGGTWAIWGQGRTIIGVGSNGENNYGNAEMMGGWDRVTLSGGQLPRHEYAATFHGQEHGTPIYNAWGNMDKGAKYGNYQNGNPRGNGAHSRQLVIGFGNDEPHENRSKYITAYFWKKTAN